MIEPEQAAHAVARLHREQLGSTYSLHDGDRSGRRLFAVSLFPERTRRFQGPQVPALAIERYILRNLDLLEDPRVSLGTWYDVDQDVTYLDVSVTLPTQEEAEQLARRYNQIGIYDLQNARWLDTGGTSEEVANLPPENERLPEQ